MDTRKRKRTEEGNDDYVDDSGDDFGTRRSSRQKQRPDYSFGIGSGRRSARASTRASSILVSSDDEPVEASEKARHLRPRPERKPPSAPQNSTRDDDRDELHESDNNDDPDFTFVQSDILQPKRRRKLKKPSRVGAAGGRSKIDLDLENRRSSRSTKNTKTMTEYVDDDDIYYVEAEETRGAPRITSMREVFQPSNSVDFKEAHRPICDSCGLVENSNKGSLVPCQGCSMSYHKGCLGTRSLREHCVTKVGQDSFVAQCRFCVGIYKKRDERAPSFDVCQGCHAKGPACAPFSQKRTPKQEEKLRLENDGVDPVTPVPPNLINNVENVLFRCTKCHRAYHYEHLPHPNSSRDPAINDPLNLRQHRLEEYQITWHCKECVDTEDEKPDKLVAWRPTNPRNYTQGQSILDFSEDEIEYLIKWQDKSYAHCAWMPGPWVFGVIPHTMRQAFVKRTFGEMIDDEIKDGSGKDSLMRWTEKEAILDGWLTPDIVLDVQYAPRSKEDDMRYRNMPRADKFENDMSRVFHVIKIYVKFEALGYDDAVWDTPPSPDSGALWDAYLEAYREFLIGKHFQAEPWRNMRERIDAFREMDFSKEIEVKEQPKGLQRGKLMGYQLEGLNWMLYNFRHERSVILADEMGLGKTVQVVALLSSFIQDNPRVWPFLIVVPNATCQNWRREIKKWAPDIRVVAYYGGRVSQGLSQRYELFPNGSKELKAHVVIMSYDSAKDPATNHRFSGVRWAGLVVDEAQALKNDENGLYKALTSLRIPFKLLLTGTPLQNNKRELFNLLQFIDPAIKAETLDERFGEITKDNLPELHDLIRPYFLRRTKAMVLTFLPTMAQIILPVSMTVLQEKLCKSIMERNPQLIRAVFARGKLKATERGSLSNILMQLRKCLCHPFVYSQAIEDRDANPEVMRRNLVEASSKLLLLEVMLPKLKERGHRVLIFSQFLDQLTILEDFLTGMDLKYERLDGGQSSMEKQKRIDAFNAPDSKLFVMLLSTRAGGVGINLATADTVIIMDPDWNPHQDMQALSRAHRIGQKKKVLCFQLMTVDSAEEKIMQIGRKKMALDHLLIESMDDKEGEASNDVESVLKHGAAALFGEGQKKDAISYDAAAVDKLLDRSAEEETKVDGDKSAESAFAFARIWAQDKGTLTDDLQTEEQTITTSVWDKILKQREEEARRELEKQMETLGRGGRRRGTTNYANPKFDFEEGQDGGLGDSETSADEDFVGADESDGESSEGEKKSESANGSNSRMSQGNGSKGTKQKPPAPKKTVARKTAGTPATPRAASKKPPSSASSSRKGQKSKPQTPQAQSQPRPRSKKGTPSTPSTGSQTGSVKTAQLVHRATPTKGQARQTNPQPPKPDRKKQAKPPSHFPPLEVYQEAVPTPAQAPSSELAGAYLPPLPIPDPSIPQDSSTLAISSI
ncbi:PHD/FYVE-zinc-finger like domain-containing protein [Cercophora scortea]|uniref:PHD/FYVE-zinc-finger like domain-containing protein n=1 Tax=Cercophora scortea TaxID=314031 RepID=A0AAE0ILU4_9PEZI|nr:PHD/FYVE-zinc-finger like domain-containing protein [Cercophora scortea]